MQLGEPCFTPRTLGKRWRCRPETVIAKIRRKQLAAFNLGLRSRPRYRISFEAVREFEAGRVEQPPPATRRSRRTRDDGVVKYF
jgi:hypothetical protein